MFIKGNEMKHPLLKVDIPENEDMDVTQVY